MIHAAQESKLIQDTSKTRYIKNPGSERDTQWSRQIWFYPCWKIPGSFKINVKYLEFLKLRAPGPMRSLSVLLQRIFLIYLVSEKLWGKGNHGNSKAVMWELTRDGCTKMATVMSSWIHKEGINHCGGLMKEQILGASQGSGIVKVALLVPRTSIVLYR